MSYIVFARKYRPQGFDEIIGQSHITAILKNAISQGRVAHAYLFTGPRGVGKTTTARIFAKALNCEKGPTPKPCNACTACQEITKASSLDILEIDGASNRGIDEIRNLRENVKFSPSKGKFKIYIIDEVHMLTPEAFNALLKTLEEPPPHVKFIFATTQPHKVPSTILSRCQRFDFRRIATKDIFENLRQIAKEEKLDIRPEALGLIAKHSDGSLRDGQVTLDQIASFSSGKVSEDDVTRMLGLVDDEILFGLSDAIGKSDASAALKIVDRISNEGKDIVQVVLAMVEHFRNIAIMKVASEAGSLIDAGSDKIELYREAAQKFTIEEILYVIYTLSNTIDFIRKTSLARIPFEAAVVKLARRGSIVSLGGMLERAEAAEKEIPRAERAGSGGQGAEQKGQSTEYREQNVVQKEQKSEDRSQKTENETQAKAGNLDEIAGSWTAVVNYVKSKKISAGSYLQEGYPVNIDAEKLSVGFPKECQFHKEVLESPENRRLIEDAVRDVLKLGLKIVLTVSEDVAIKGRGQNQVTEDTAGAAELADAADEPSSQVDPIIKSALEIFGGAISGEAQKRTRAR
jgi:DNA polymerase III subunit gamma/tau